VERVTEKEQCAVLLHTGFGGVLLEIGGTKSKGAAVDKNTWSLEIVTPSRFLYLNESSWILISWGGEEYGRDSKWVIVENVGGEKARDHLN